jgi:hypothetical protein
MKKNQIAILLLVLIATIFYSCNKLGNGLDSGSNEKTKESDIVRIEEIEKPTVAKIQNDLIGNSVDNWNFAKLEEFKNTKMETPIINYDNSTLEIVANVDLVNYETLKPYKGQIVITYSLEGTTWEFNKVEGYINSTSKETSSATGKTIETKKEIFDSSSIDKKDGSSTQNTKSSKSKNFIICPKCNGVGNVESTCRRCAGSGYLGKIKCSTCKGKGTQTVKCTVCRGERMVKENE